ncbi:MAG: hypothetical protein ACYDC3_10255 [Candidatus Binataceae bacterium]
MKFITESELAAELRVSTRTISRLLARHRGKLGEDQGVFRFSRSTLRFDPEIAIASISRAFRESKERI